MYLIAVNTPNIICFAPLILGVYRGTRHLDNEL